MNKPRLNKQPSPAAGQNAWSLSNGESEISLTVKGGQMAPVNFFIILSQTTFIQAEYFPECPSELSTNISSGSFCVSQQSGSEIPEVFNVQLSKSPLTISWAKVIT